MPPITNPKEGEAERFYDDLQELLELTPKKKKDVLFIIGDWNAKVGTPLFLSGEFHVERSLVGYSPWGPKSWTQLNIYACMDKWGLSPLGPYTSVLDEKELAERYGAGAILAGGLIVDGLAVFNP